jgi:hypothetical protein
VAEEPVADPGDQRLGVVLVDRPGGDVARAAAIEIAGGAVVVGVVVAPVGEALEDEQAEDPPAPRVRAPRVEERGVGAVVEEDERAQQTSSARYITAQRAKNGTTEVAMSRSVRARLGCAYGAMVLRQ